MSADRPNPMRQDLRKRTRQFALRVIRVHLTLGHRGVGHVIGKQLLRSGTSVGAHYHEAYRSRSKAEYISKLGGALQELEETLYWLKLSVEASLIPQTRLKDLQSEANELIAIFTAIVKRTKAGK